jgi:hypothetical protein
MAANREQSWPASLGPGLWEMVAAFDSRQLNYALVGGLAVGFRSRFRFTQDLDFLLEVPQVVLPGLLEDLKARGYTFEDEVVIREWVRDHMTCLNYGAMLVDWLKPVVPCYRHVLDQASSVEMDGRALKIAQAEGLIVTKLIAFRTQDQADIETLLASNAGGLNLDLIRQEWASVGDVDDPRMIRFEEMVRQFYAP